MAARLYLNISAKIVAHLFITLLQKVNDYVPIHTRIF